MNIDPGKLINNLFERVEMQWNAGGADSVMRAFRVTPMEMQAINAYNGKESTGGIELCSFDSVFGRVMFYTDPPINQSEKCFPGRVVIGEETTT